MTEIIITLILTAFYLSFYVFSLTWIGELIWFGVMFIASRALYRLDRRIRGYFELFETLERAGIHVED